MKQDKKLHIAITGAPGFIGSYLKNYFLNKDYYVTAFFRNTRRISAKENLKIQQFDLTDFDTDLINSDIDVLIHTAYIKKEDHKEAEKINIKSSMKLKSICAEKNIKFVFLSSFSAKENAKSAYGKAKFIIQNSLDYKSDLILRIGLVIGEGGVYKSISNYIERLKIIPLIGSGNQPVQTISISQLAEIIGILILRDLSGIINIAEEKPILMKNLYKEIAVQKSRKVIFLPIPYFVSDIAFNIIEKLKLKIDINRDSYLGLKNSSPEKKINTNKTIGVDIFNFKKNIELLN